MAEGSITIDLLRIPEVQEAIASLQERAETAEVWKNELTKALDVKIDALAAAEKRIDYLDDGLTRALRTIRETRLVLTEKGIVEGIPLAEGVRELADRNDRQKAWLEESQEALRIARSERDALKGLPRHQFTVRKDPELSRRGAIGLLSHMLEQIATGEALVESALMFPDGSAQMKIRKADVPRIGKTPNIREILRDEAPGAPKLDRPTTPPQA